MNEQGETVGDIEIRPCYLFKGNRPPTWNLYRNGKDTHEPLASNVRSKTLAWMLATTYNTLTNTLKMKVDAEVRATSIEAHTRGGAR